MTNVFKRLRESAELGFCAATLCVAGACGSGGGGNVDNSRNLAEAKNNMSVAKAGGDSVAVTPAGPSTSIRTPVVLFFGTSLTPGYGLDPEQAFPSLIEKKTAAEGLHSR